MNESSWIDRLISNFADKTGSNKRTKVKILGFLEDDYLTAMHLADMITVEGARIRYPYLKEEVDQLAQKNRKFANLLKEIIMQSGGEPVKKPSESYFPRGNFKIIFDKMSEWQNTLVGHLNFSEEYGYSEIAEQLSDIRRENYELIEKLERVIMRINTEI
jgi:hypothetical protein